MITIIVCCIIGLVVGGIWTWIHDQRADFVFPGMILGLIISLPIAVILSYTLGFICPQENKLVQEVKLYSISEDYFVLANSSSDSNIYNYIYKTKNRMNQPLYQIMEDTCCVNIIEDDKNIVYKEYDIIGEGDWKYWATVIWSNIKEFHVPKNSVDYGYDMEPRNEVDYRKGK